VIVEPGVGLRLPRVGTQFWVQPRPTFRVLAAHTGCKDPECGYPKLGVYRNTSARQARGPRSIGDFRPRRDLAASGTRHAPRIPWIGDILMNDLFAFAVSHPTTLLLFATMMFKAGKLSA
jgi:hypothetical protein